MERGNSKQWLNTQIVRCIAPGPGEKPGQMTKLLAESQTGYRHSSEASPTEAVDIENAVLIEKGESTDSSANKIL